MNQLQAAIYARISSDPSHEGLGVQRQLQDCRKLAADRGWVIAEEYVDNDLSAYSGRWRPEYERMLTDLADKRIDRVLVWHLDRLTRRPIELERVIEVCTAANVDITTVTGDVGLGHDSGLLVARVVSAVAAAESSRKSARLRRGMQQQADMGKPNGGANRPFGYEQDKITVRQSEAAIIRQLVKRYIAGESMTSLVRWMNRKEIPTVAGARAWQLQALRPILLSGRIAGIRDHHGQPVADAVWPAIISKRQHEKMLAAYEARRHPPYKPPQLHLLSGMLRCGRCGATLVTAIPRGQRRYSCPSAPGREGCRQLSINAAHIEEWAEAAVLIRLESPEMAGILTARGASNDRTKPQVAELLRAQETITRLAQMLGAGELSLQEFAAAREVADARRAAAYRELDHATGTNTLDELEDGIARRLSWDRLSLEKKRAIMRTLLDHVTIQPRPRGIRKLDPTRVEPSWVDA